ncbi:MAG: ATP-binding cassette domain-containing protein [Gammaproteobacteria bacterium]
MTTRNIHSAMVIILKNIATQLGDKIIHQDVNLQIQASEIVALVGSSGCGKTTLLNCMIMLLRPSAGDIEILGTDILHCSREQAQNLRRRWGVMFQHCALFSSLTVLENVIFPLRELSQLSPSAQRDIALLKLNLVGLPSSAAYKYPSELSGGMQKRAALARALVLDPEILFLDEPTAGLDPQSADKFDELILYLRDSLQLTIVMVTHDMDSLWRISDRVAFIGEQRILACEPMRELVHNTHPEIKAFFAGPRNQQRINNQSETYAKQ